MRKIEPRTYETAEELDQRLRQAEAEAASLEGPERQAALIELAKLRIYAQAKRWMETGRAQLS
jgi:hypothetical protein